MPKIDICIVSTRRPDLLSATLSSFSKSVFRHFEIDRTFINIDPIFGDENDHKQCIDHFRSLFPAGVVFEPETANFTAAVQRLWSATRAEFVVHLEDDWVALTDIDRSALEPFQDTSVSQVSLHTAEKNWDIRKKGHFHKKNTYITIFGIKMPTFGAIPRFTTSPSFLRGDFARNCSTLMDLSRDPEKQFYSGVNPALEAYARQKKNYLFSRDNQPVIADIGRDWRKERKITKTIRDSNSVWEVDHGTDTR